MRCPLLHFSRRAERCVWVGSCVRSLCHTPLLALLRAWPRGLSSAALAAYPIDGPHQAMFWSFLGRVYGLPYRPSALRGGSISVFFLVVVSIPRLGANFRRCLYLAYYLIRFCVYSVEFGSFARGDSPPIRCRWFGLGVSFKHNIQSDRKLWTGWPCSCFERELQASKFLRFPTIRLTKFPTDGKTRPGFLHTQKKINPTFNRTGEFGARTAYFPPKEDGARLGVLCLQSFRLANSDTVIERARLLRT